MKEIKKRQSRFIQWALLLLLIIFVYMIRAYLVPLLLGLIFASLLEPTNRWIQTNLKLGKGAASGLTTILFFLIFIIPGFLLVDKIVTEAFQVSKGLIPLLQQQLSQDGGDKSRLPDWVPFKDVLDPYTQQIYQKLASLAGSFSTFMVETLSNLTQGTAMFILNFVIMVFSIFSFMNTGERMKAQAQKYLPLSPSQFNGVRKEVLNVSRATIKGALVIGVIQGIMMGFGMYAAGLPGPVFWGAVTVVASMIPGVGAAIIYIPASIYLLATGHQTAGLGLLAWGLGAVGTIDNVLRPKLVGKDLEMSDLTVLISTLGGIGLFGITGIILGPLIVGLLTVFIRFNYEEEHGV